MLNIDNIFDLYSAHFSSTFMCLDLKCVMNLFLQSFTDDFKWPASVILICPGERMEVITSPVIP